VDGGAGAIAIEFGSFNRNSGQGIQEKNWFLAFGNQPVHDGLNLLEALNGGIGHSSAVVERSYAVKRITTSARVLMYGKTEKKPR
jgi:hypothetical protein